MNKKQKGWKKLWAMKGKLCTCTPKLHTRKLNFFSF